MGAAHRQCTQVGTNYKDLAIGNWNVLSLTRKELELVCDAQQYRLHIVGISSTKRQGSGTVELNGWWKRALADWCMPVSMWDWANTKAMANQCGYAYPLARRQEKMHQL